MNAEQVKKNLVILDTTLKALQALVNEKQKNTGATYFYEAFTLAAAARIVHRRLEMEARLLGGRVAQPPPELPETPEAVRRNPQAIKDSDFYKLCWSHLTEKKQ